MRHKCRMEDLELKGKKKALVIATVGGFLPKFEMGNARILQELGYEVHYAANLGNPVYRLDTRELKDAGICLHNVAIEKSPFAFGAHRRALKELVALIKAEGICLVHCHTPVGGFLGRMAGKRIGGSIKVIYTSHGFHFYKGAPFPEGRLFQCVERYLARFTDVLVTVNKEDYENARRFRLRPNGKVYWIPGVGLDMEKFRPPTLAERRECRRRLGIPEDAFFLLSVGELNRNKNHKVVLEALARLGWENGSCRNMRETVREQENMLGCGYVRERAGKMYLYGVCGEGSSRTALEADIARLGLKDQVMLYGYCDPRPYLAAADAFLFPSRREGLGMAALEALSMGVPVAAADNRGSREYMQSGRNGYVFVWNDPEDCAGCIRRLAGMGAEERAQMRQSCRKSVRGFSVRETEKVMYEVYRDTGMDAR